MSDVMKLEVEVPTNASGTVMVPQYGMRYPNGTIGWGGDGNGTIGWGGDGNGRDEIPFKRLHERHYGHVDRWNARLKNRADAASVDAAEYIAAHQPLTRTVIVVVMEPEELKVSDQHSTVGKFSENPF